LPVVQCNSAPWKPGGSQSRRVAQSLNTGRILGKREEGVAEALSLPRPDQHPGRSGYVAHTGKVRGDRDAARGHALEEDESECLSSRSRRKHDNVMLGVQAP